MSQTLDHVIALLTDGHPVDWESLLENATDGRERARLEELRGLSQLDAEEALARGASTGVPQSRWGHLELLEELGRGAYGFVYRAWDTRLAREVALKLTANVEDGGNLDEARRLARIKHPNVVGVYGVDLLDGQIGLSMELLKGRTLDTMLADQGPFSEREAVAIALEICGAVAAIHSAGLVHRDIKAQNVIREPGGRMVLMDFGASIDATHDEVGVKALTGTPLYMAPELFDGKPPSVVSDIYALGVLLYRLVTVDFPVHGHTMGDVRLAHAAGRLRPLRDVRPELTSSFVRVVDRCLAANSDDRFQTVAAVERALYDSGRPLGSRLTASQKFVAATALALALVGLTWGAFAWTYRTRLEDGSNAPRATMSSVTAEQYQVFAGYEELAFSERMKNPAAAIAAMNGAASLIHTTATSNNPVVALIRARQSESWRLAGDREQAEAQALNAAAHAVLSVGEEHPYSAVVAMESARNAQAAGDHRRAAAEILRALGIRWRILGLSELTGRQEPRLDQAAVERNSGRFSAVRDSDGDGLIDLVEAAAGLDPQSGSSGADATTDDDRYSVESSISNRLALGLGGSPYLTWAHFGGHDPRYIAWQPSPTFPMTERSERSARFPAWSMSVPNSQGLFMQRFARVQSLHAATFGFSLLVRVQPTSGVSFAMVDLGPVGARYDIAARRISDSDIEVSLLSSVIPRAGSGVVVPSPIGGRVPILELRYRPEWNSAALYVDGRLRLSGYVGHHQFQLPDAGGVSWGIIGDGSRVTRAAAAFNLVWLEFFGAGR